jgi:ribosomal protein S8E
MTKRRSVTKWYWSETALISIETNVGPSEQRAHGRKHMVTATPQRDRVTWGRFEKRSIRNIFRPTGIQETFFNEFVGLQLLCVGPLERKERMKRRSHLSVHPSARFISETSWRIYMKYGFGETLKVAGAEKGSVGISPKQFLLYMKLKLNFHFLKNRSSNQHYRPH